MSDKERKLLKPFGFTFFKAVKLMMFAFIFSSFGFSFAAYKANVALSDVTQLVSKKLASDFLSLSRLYRIDRNNEPYLISFKSAPSSVYYRRLGSADLSLNRAELIKVKAQKKKISASTYLLRYKSLEDQKRFMFLFLLGLGMQMKMIPMIAPQKAIHAPCNHQRICISRSLVSSLSAYSRLKLSNSSI